MRAVAQRLAGSLGLTRGVSWTLAGRVWSLIAGVVTIVLIARALTPAGQGTYYVISSLLAAQVFAELGLNFVLVQRTARAAAPLTVGPDLTFSGPAEAIGAVGALLRFGTRWFLVGGALFGVVGGLVGAALLMQGAQGDPPLLPWLVAAAGATVLLASLGPLAVFEGSGFVAEVAAIRFAAGASGAVATWGALNSGAGIWAVAVAPWVSGVVTWGVSWHRLGAPWRDLLARAGGHSVAWREEILPFQLRIAASWLAGYFVSQAPTALLFAAHRSEDAGRYGMSMSIASAVGTVASSWLYPAQPQLVRLTALRDVRSLDDLFARTVRRTLLIGGVCAVTLVAAVALLPISPAAAYVGRVLPVGGFAALMTGLLGSVLAACFAAYARAGGGEPFLVISLASAASLLLAAVVAVPRFGASGVAVTYAMVQWGIGVFGGYLVYRAKRSRLRGEI